MWWVDVLLRLMWFLRKFVVVLKCFGIEKMVSI